MRPVMHDMHRYKYALTLTGAWLAIAGAWHAVAAAELAGRVRFADPRSPPPWTEVHPAARRDFDRGRTIFNSPWLPAGHADAARDGLGPLFVQPSCDGCHKNGARGGPAASAGQLSSSFVMQLDGAPTSYGHVLNTQAIAGHSPEGRITVTWQQRSGNYPDGQRWTLREPRYALRDLVAGPLPAGTVLKPRIAPALFGAGLLDGAAQAAVEAMQLAQPAALRGSAGGRFGWQGGAASLVDQTALAFAREMGLTSEFQPRDDCTPAQASCRQAPHGGEPEVSEQVFHAVTTFQFLLAAPARGQLASAADAAGAALFERVGCAACHAPRLPVVREQGEILIDAYTDLLQHDLGSGLADRTVDGRVVQSRWRTAPLWGLAEALRAGQPALLHDGRAAGLEEAILWHEGQAATARGNFMALDAATRRQLLDWLATL
jgi:CxxC motif-containing protein (DUF1111 family)